MSKLKTGDKMKKITTKIVVSIVLLLATMSSSFSFEKKLSLYVGSSSGGQLAAFQTIISKELENRGWKMDFKIISNCGQVNNMLNTMDTPLLAGWFPAYNTSEDNKCFHQPTMANFLGVYLSTPRLVCGPVGQPNFKIVKGKKYNIGVNKGQGHGPILNDLGKEIGVTFKVIEYKNSGFIKRAMQAKEIEMFYTTGGLFEHETRKQKCFYGTLLEERAGITPLKDLLSKPYVYTNGTGYFVSNKALYKNKALKKALEKDINEIIALDSYKESLKFGGAFIPDIPKQEQLNFVNANALAYVKQ